MSTEEPSPPGLVRESPDRVTKIGGVELHAGQMLLLHSQDYYYNDDWMSPERLMLVEIARVGDVLPNGSHIMIEGFKHLDHGSKATSIAVRISALASSLTPPVRGN